ncbi:AzlD domain-containing protein [Aeromicrobium sp. NPDC092404]|uniref:AzlD domain-containing protein n=1 Tax=Aeromicrobium sp. NPDC092404 TaxID=3154976 RepID=UPI003434CEC2
MTETIWLTIAGCTVVTFAIKAFGPVLMGGRELPDRVNGVIMLMAPALLAALVVSSALADGEHLHVGADTAGVAAGAGVLVLTRAGVLTSVLVAAVVTAGLRLLA